MKKLVLKGFPGVNVQSKFPTQSQLRSRSKHQKKSWWQKVGDPW